MRTAHLLPVSPSMHCLGGVPGLEWCTWSGVVYLVWGVPGPRGGEGGGGGVPGPERGSTWSRGVYLVPGGVPGPGAVSSPRGCTFSWGVNLVLGVYLVLGGVPGPRGYIWSGGVYVVPGGVPGLRWCTWSGGCVPGLGGVYLVPGVYLFLGVYLPRYSPLWTEWLRDRCKNITFANFVKRALIFSTSPVVLLPWLSV